MTDKIVKRCASHPSLVFLIDGAGALLSAILLGVILPAFQNLFGMPRQALYFLAVFPCLFLVYDLSCYFRIRKNWGPFIRAIAAANLIYCGISIGLIVYHYAKLTGLGLTYFLLEIVVIIILVWIEFSVLYKLSKQ